MNSERSASLRIVDTNILAPELPVAISKQVGKAYAIEPNSDRNECLVSNSSESRVEIRKGIAENLPFEDNKFDAAVTLWILHYVDDLEQSLAEMARVVDPNAPNVRIVIVQGAPDNEVVNLINKAALPSPRNPCCRAILPSTTRGSCSLRQSGSLPGADSMTSRSRGSMRIVISLKMTLIADAARRRMS